MKLHEISKDYIGFIESDMDKEQLEECLDSIKGEFDDKALNIVKVVNTLNSNVDSLSAEIDRLTKKRSTIKKNQERMREYLRYNMEVTGITKISHPLFNISLGKPTVIAEIVDADFLPDEYVNTSVSIKPDKKAILAALKAGDDVAGAVLSTGKARLLIS